jgi:hypothetical protein
MTRQQLLNEVDPSIKAPLTAALDELSDCQITFYLSEGRRVLLTQCLYALQGRLGEIPASDLQWACKQAGIRDPGTGKITWTLRSRHFDGRAVDIVPVLNDKVLWTYTGNEAAYNAIAVIMKKHGFIWGGDWKEKDYQHYEM